MEMYPIGAQNYAHPRVSPPREEDTGELIGFYRVIGGLAGSIVFVSSIILSLSSLVATFIVQGKAYEVFDHKFHTTKFMGYKLGHQYLILSYCTIVVLFLSLLLGQIYIYVIIGIAALFSEQERPLRKWIKYFKIIFLCYWLSFLAAEICLIVIIAGLHRKEISEMPFQVTKILETLTILFSIGLHLIAVRIQWIISVLDQINALAEEVRVDQENEYEECSICIDTLAIGDIVRELPCCRRKFHKTCVDDWLIKHPRCPICRTRI